MKQLTNLLRSGYELLVAGGAVLQSPFLLALRLYFFWQLFLTGKGKLENIGKVTEFFASLGIPLPTLNAYLIGSLECFGSLLLIIGLASRPLSLLIVISMTVAYLTADFEAVSNIFSDPDRFVKADPFPFLLGHFRTQGSARTTANHAVFEGGLRLAFINKFSKTLETLNGSGFR